MRGPWDMSKKSFFPILKILIFRVKDGQKTPKYQDKAGSGPLQPRVLACFTLNLQSEVTVNKTHK